MRFLRFLLAATVLCLVAGCQATEAPASMQDDMSKDIFAPLFGNANGLSTPYVQGSTFGITVVAGSGQNSAGWQLTSSNPTVMVVGAHDPPSTPWSVTASGIGESTLSVVDTSGKVLDSAVIQVEAPTSVQLCAQGLLISGESDSESTVSTIQVVSGGTATFLARYFNGSQELFGNNALHPTGSGVASATTASADYSVRDFLEVSAADAGSGSVSLGVGQLETQVPVVAVDPSTIAKVGYAAESEANASKGETMYVFGRAFDAQGDDFFGASFAWSVDGTPLTPLIHITNGPTDLLTYQYTPSQTETVADSLEGFSASTVVHGAPSTTAASSTENVGCAIARGVGSDRAAAGGAALLASLGLLVARRRRGCSA